MTESAMNPRERRMNPNEPSKANTRAILKLFVYGTLNRGFWNHDRFCSQAVGIEPATTWGRLYHLSAGFPALEVPETCILAHGTADPIADARTQNSTEMSGNAMAQPNGDWDLVHGELMTFANPAFDLPPLDRLEGFNPNGHSMYQRVLVAVEMQNYLHTCWIYHGLNHILQDGLRLFKGCWEGRKLGYTRLNPEIKLVYLQGY